MIHFQHFLRLKVDLHCHVIFRVKKIEAMYERPRINVKVEPRSTLTFTRSLSYIASILCTRVKFASVRTEKLRVSGNQP